MAAGAREAPLLSLLSPCEGDGHGGGRRGDGESAAAPPPPPPPPASGETGGVVEEKKAPAAAPAPACAWENHRGWGSPLAWASAAVFLFFCFFEVEEK